MSRSNMKVAPIDLGNDAFDEKQKQQVGQQQQQQQQQQQPPGHAKVSTPTAGVAPPGFRAIGVKVTPWKPDDTKCYICEDKFTWFNHRHRCRNCQEYVCNPCALSRKVLRAYSPPKRVCNTCIDKYWAPKKPAAAAANDTDRKPGHVRHLSLTVAPESFPVDGPTTAPMSVSPSTPMLDGAFFACSNGADGDETAGAASACRGATPMLSPSLLATTLEEGEEEDAAASPAALLSPPGTCGTSGTFFRDQEDGEEVTFEVNYDGDDEASKEEETVRGECPFLLLDSAPTVTVADEASIPEKELVEEREAQQEQDGDNLDCQLAGVVHDEVVEEEEEPVAAAEVGQPVGLVDATVFLLALAAAALPSVMQQAVSSSAGGGDNESKNERGVGGLLDGELVSFAVGLGWGVAAAGVGFGVAVFLRKL